MKIQFRLISKWLCHEIEKWSYMPNSKNVVSVVRTSKWGRINLDLSCKSLPRLKGEMLAATGPFQWYLPLDKIRSLISAEVERGFDADDEWLAFSSRCPASIRRRIEDAQRDYDLDGTLIEENDFYYLPSDSGSYLGGGVEIIDLENQALPKRVACAPDGIFKEYASCWEVNSADLEESKCIAKALYIKDDKELELSYSFNDWTVTIFAATTSMPQLNNYQAIPIADKPGYLERLGMSLHDDVTACVLRSSALRKEMRTQAEDGVVHVITEDVGSTADIVFRGNFGPEEQLKVEEFIRSFDNSESYPLVEGPLQGFRLVCSWVVVSGFEVKEDIVH